MSRSEDARSRALGWLIPFEVFQIFDFLETIVKLRWFTTTIAQTTSIKVLCCAANYFGPLLIQIITAPEGWTGTESEPRCPGEKVGEKKRKTIRGVACFLGL